MDSNFSQSMQKTARIIHAISSHFGSSMGKVHTISRCLSNHSQNTQSMQLNRKLRRLLATIKRNHAKSPEHKEFWNNIKRIIKGTSDYLLMRKNKIETRKTKSHSPFPSTDSTEDILSVLKTTDLQCPVPFWFAVPELFNKFVVKVSEGSFGEVFRITKDNGEKRILKVIPVGDLVPGSQQRQPVFKNLIAEIHTSLELSKLSKGCTFHCGTFPTTHKVNVVQDVLPTAAVKAWTKYAEKCTTNHPHPDRYLSDQVYVTIETEFAGVDLDHFPIKNYVKALSIFKQIALAVAVAESKLHFEHRDLHLNNILLKRCQQAFLHFRLNNRRFTIPTHGVKATIIDFTFSRIETDEGVKFLNLDGIYDARPYAPGEFLDHRYVYAKMADLNSFRWQDFTPKTNLLWLKHLVECLLQKIGKIRGPPRGTLEASAMTTLSIFNRLCLASDSTVQFVNEQMM